MVRLQLAATGLAGGGPLRFCLEDSGDRMRWVWYQWMRPDPMQENGEIEKRKVVAL